MKKKDYFKLWLLSFATWGCLIPLRGYYVGLYGATIILTIAFALLTWWAMKKYAEKAGFRRVLIPLLAPWLFVELAFVFNAHLRNAAICRYHDSHFLSLS